MNKAIVWMSKSYQWHCDGYRKIFWYSVWSMALIFTVGAILTYGFNMNYNNITLIAVSYILGILVCLIGSMRFIDEHEKKLSNK